VLRVSRAFAGLERRREQVEDALGMYVLVPGLLLASCVLSLAVQLANVVVVWSIGIGLDLPVPAGYYAVLVPMVTLLTLAPISLNGMGVREGGTVLLLVPLGIDPAAALSLAFLWFAAFTVPSLAGVFPYLLGRVPRVEVQCDAEPIGRHSDQGRTRQPRAAA
jgi:uncharacterized membrane protein YbhN (UPF0104 family)